MTTRLLVAAALAVTASGCAGEEGELGVVDFIYTCSAEEQDAACDEEGGNAVFSGFPDVAVGGRFQVGFQGYHDKVIASELFLTPEGDDIVAQRAGACAIMALDTRNLDGRGEDLMHVTIREIDSIALMFRASGSSEFESIASSGLTMTQGASLLLRAVPQAAGSMLAGGLTYGWASSDTQVVQLEPTVGNKIEIVPAGQGTTTISVQHAGLSAQTTVEVLP